MSQGKAFGRWCDGACFSDFEQKNEEINGCGNIGQHGDNAAKAIANHGDDAINLITKHGDNAAKAIADRGNNAIIVISSAKNGKKAAEVIANSSDELFERIINSQGYADDIIQCVNDFGENAARAIEKYGDDAAVAISLSKNGKKAAEVIANSSDELFERIMNSHGYADDIVECVAKYNGADKAIISFGDEAIVVINEFTEYGIDALNKGITPKTINLLVTRNVNPKDYVRLCINNEKMQIKYLIVHYLMRF